MTDESNLVEKTSCPECGSSDANAVYDDGHTFCFSCGHFVRGDGTSSSAAKPTEFTPVEGVFRAINKRGISEETAKKYGYRIGTYRGGMVHVCDVRLQDGTLVAQKIRTKDKEFFTEGSVKARPLVGMHLFSGGNRIVITEGEVDMLTMSQVQGNRYPVVSLPNGVQNARKVIASNLEYLQNFKEIAICFDMDDVGQKAAQECADLLLGNNVKLMQLPLKDPNEMMLAGRTEELINAMWNAKTHKPDALLDVDDLMERALEPMEKGMPWVFEGMNKSSNGRHFGEVHTLGAGTGVGKTDMLLQQADYDMRHLHQKVGLFLVENDPAEVLQYLGGKADGRLYYEPEHPDQEDKEAQRKAYAKYRGKCFIYDNFGLCDWSSVKTKITYLISLGYRVFYVDHLTALATGGEKNEKEELETIMADIAEFAKRHNVLFHLVSHLTTPEGKSHEEGGRVTIKLFKGSRAIGFWSHAMYGLERNQQAENESERNVTTVRQLKRRKYGKGVGKTTYLRYDQLTGRLNETSQDTESLVQHTVDEF